jgi:predicted phage terminase large subunit-like protein
MEQNPLLQAILRCDLKSFIHKVFHTINPGMEFHNSWYIDSIAQYLEEITRKGGQRLIINIPPRCLKSISISVAWPAWLLGIAPSKRIIVASYSQNLSTKHSLDCRAIIQSLWYQELFPKTIISQCQKNKFTTTQFGFRIATSVGGSITGEGADILIVDDPHNPTHIYSEKIRKQAIDWFQQTFLTRLNDPQKGSVAIVMQRLHSQDLSGHLLQKGNWSLLKIAAIAKERQILNSGEKSYVIEQNSLLDETRLPHDLLEKIEQQIGSTNFKAQYLQEPEERFAGMLKLEEIKFYDQLPCFEEIYQSWDTAIKVNSESDYSVATTWGVFQNRYYLIDFICQKLEYSYLKKSVVDMAKKWLPKMILIEDKGSGQSLIQDLKLENIYNIAPQKPKLDKITRFALILHFFMLEQVLLPQKSAWSQQVIEQLTSFPFTKHDDIVDSVSQFLNYIKITNSSNKNPRLREL